MMSTDLFRPIADPAARRIVTSMSDQEVIELSRRWARLKTAEEALHTRFNAAERADDRRALAACSRRFHQLARQEDEIARLAVATRSSSLVGVAYKLWLWRQESALTGFENPLDLFAFGAYRDAVRIAKLANLRHAKDSREMREARRWSCKIA